MNPQFNEEFNEAVQRIGQTGTEYADAKALSWQLQELKGVVLSQLMKAQGSIAISKAEMFAKASDDYKNCIKGISEAIREELTKKAYYEKSRAEFEKLRSLCSLEKSTQKEIGI